MGTEIESSNPDQLLVVSLCILSLFRPSFEVVREGRISYKIRYLQDQFVGVFFIGASFRPGFEEKETTFNS